MVNILVVEDDIKLNQIVCAHLEKNGYSVSGCNTPEEAYDVMYKSFYDMIISDIMLPKTDGFELGKPKSKTRNDRCCRLLGRPWC